MLLICSKISPGVFSCGSLTTSNITIILGPSTKFFKMEISLLIFFRLTGFNTLITTFSLFSSLFPKDFGVLTSSQFSKYLVIFLRVPFYVKVIIVPVGLWFEWKGHRHIPLRLIALYYGGARTLCYCY